MKELSVFIDESGDCGEIVMESKCENCGGKLNKGQMAGTYGIFFIRKER